MGELQTIFNYELKEKIGGGGFGIVRRAVHKDSGRVVAVKLLPEGLANDETFVRRFRQEIKILGNLKHPNIVDFVNADVENGTPYLMMEFCEGGSLEDRLNSKILPVNQVIGISRQVLGALAYAHKRGIIHGDIHPGNILFDSNGKVRIGDFGLANIVEDLVRKGSYSYPGFSKMGRYAAFERKDGVIVPQNDVYSFSLTLAEIFGRKPGNQRPLREINRNVPEDLAALIEKNLYEYTSRHKDAHEMLKALRSFEEAQKQAYNRRSAIALGSLALAVLFGGFIGLNMLFNKTPDSNPTSAAGTYATPNPMRSPLPIVTYTPTRTPTLPPKPTAAFTATYTPSPVPAIPQPRTQDFGPPTPSDSIVNNQGGQVPTPLEEYGSPTATPTRIPSPAQPTPTRSPTPIPPKPTPTPYVVREYPEKVGTCVYEVKQMSDGTFPKRLLGCGPTPTSTSTSDYKTSIAPINSLGFSEITGNPTLDSDSGRKVIRLPGDNSKVVMSYTPAKNDNVNIYTSFYDFTMKETGQKGFTIRGIKNNFVSIIFQNGQYWIQDYIQWPLPIERSKGWHSLKLAITPNSGHLYIDERDLCDLGKFCDWLLFRSSEFSKIEIYNFSADKTPFYWTPLISTVSH